MSLYGLGNENSNSGLTQPIDYLGIPPYASKKPAPKKKSEATREFRERMEKEISGIAQLTRRSIPVSGEESKSREIPIKIL